jgi:hypothetical protein
MRVGRLKDTRDAITLNWGASALDLRPHGVLVTY